MSKPLHGMKVTQMQICKNHRRESNLEHVIQFMVRLSPGIMADAEGWLQGAIAERAAAQLLIFSYLLLMLSILYNACSIWTCAPRFNQQLSKSTPPTPPHGCSAWIY